MKLLFIILSYLYSSDALDLIHQMESISKPNDIKVNITLEIRRKKVKTLNFRSIIKNNGKKQIIWFTNPPSEKGISFLKITEENFSEDLRMWLPAFKKVRRISSSKKSNSFMGSDFSYEDLFNRNKQNYTYRLLPEIKTRDESCHVLESIPNEDLKSNYSKHITWISKSNLIPIKEKSYDKNNDPIKEKQFYYRKIDGFWIAKEIEIKNIKNNKSSKVIIDNIKINTNVEDEIFQEKNLKRLPK